MTDPRMESPLVGQPQPLRREMSVDGRDCSLDELPFMDMINLRGDAAQPVFATALLELTGLALPLLANTASRDGGRQLIWLGPDEWLLKLPSRQGEAMAAALRSALTEQHASVVEVGSGNTTLVLIGPAAADLLSRGCPLDLHPRVFLAGSAAQSHVARAAALIFCVEAGVHFEITVRRSFADYLYRWLCEAGG